jgi:hypothetical protein
MPTKRLHIISFAIPYPPDYGGVMDVFFRLKALHSVGYRIHLHCFQYAREKSPVLEQLCEKVDYYQRDRGFRFQLSSTPFIVKTRAHPRLLNNLLADSDPILFEGLHSCAFLSDHRLKDRFKIVRCHNVEQEYYQRLAGNTSSLLKKVYLYLESLKISFFERVLIHADVLAAISSSDLGYFRKMHERVFLLSPFHPYSTLSIQPGKGDFILYHGHLGVSENEESVQYILSHVAPFIDFPVVIAGKSPSPALQTAISRFSHLRLVADPQEEEMNQLITQAHIILLPVMQASGFKLKLLSSLFQGRFCVGTPELVAGTGLESEVLLAESPSEMLAAVRKCLGEEFSNEQVEHRKSVLVPRYTNKAGLLALAEVLE